MRRRPFLEALAAGSSLLAAGCVSLREDPGPFDFGISNWRDRQYTADFVLRKNDARLLDGRVDVPAKRPSDEGPVGVLLEDVTRVTDGDVIEARINLSGSEFEGRYEVSCNRRERAENNFFFRIYSDEDRGMEFEGSEC